jgi:hypothetical protein
MYDHAQGHLDLAVQKWDHQEAQEEVCADPCINSDVLNLYIVAGLSLSQVKLLDSEKDRAHKSAKIERIP